MTLKELIKATQRALNERGEKLTEDGDPGVKTQEALSRYDSEVKATPKKEETKPVAVTEAPPWYVEAKKYEGKKETDPAFAAAMIPKWKLVGLKLGTISKSFAAWCGLAMAVALAGVGIDHQKNGALA